MKEVTIDRSGNYQLSITDTLIKISSGANAVVKIIPPIPYSINREKFITLSGGRSVTLVLNTLSKNWEIEGGISQVTNISETNFISGRVSTFNSTTTPLAAYSASGTAFRYTGQWEDVSSYPSVVVAIKTDQNGFYSIQFSPDGVNTDSSLSFYYHTDHIEAPHRYTVTRKYFRVLFENTSSSSQTYFRLQSLLGGQAALNSPTDSALPQHFDALSVRPTNFSYEVALGLRDGNITFNKFGYNGDIDIGTETLWAPGGTFSKMTSAATLSIVSSSANDDDGGTGANSVVIIGVDGDWNIQTEVVTLNGTTPVITTNTWLGVNRMAIYLAGTGEANAGTITATATGGGSTLQASIPIGEGTTQQAIFFVPVNYTALADFLYLNAEKTGGGGSPKVRFKGWVFSDVSNCKYLVYNELLDTASSSAISIMPSQPFTIAEKSILYFEATTDTNDTFASARFCLIEVRAFDA